MVLNFPPEFVTSLSRLFSLYFLESLFSVSGVDQEVPGVSCGPVVYFYLLSAQAADLLKGAVTVSHKILTRSYHA